MGKIAFVNDNKSTETEHSLNTMISFRRYEEYLKLIDMDKQNLNEQRKDRLREQIKNFRAEKAAKRAVNSDKFNKTLEKELGKIIQDELDKE